MLFLLIATNLKLAITADSLRLIYLSWMLASLILATAYSSSFYSILSVPAHVPPIDSLNDLLNVAKSDAKFILMLGNSAFLTRFKYSAHGTDAYYLIGQHINR